MPLTPRIAIVGAGPAGLTLGVLLHNKQIPFTIFELRPRFTDEELATPSGSLDLHEETGLAAIRACGLEEQFLILTTDCTEAQVIANKQGEIIYADQGDRSRPEVSRHKLVKLLLDRLPNSVFRWDHKLLSAKGGMSPDTTIELDFGDNGKHEFDLVIGADGAWSKIRAMLTQERPEYAGAQCITLNLTDVDAQAPRLSDFIGTGSFSCLADHHGIMSQRSGDNARIYVFISADDEHYARTTGLADMTPIQAKECLIGSKGLFSSWGQNVQQLVGLACDNEATSVGTRLDIKPLYRLPIGHTWVHHPSATLVGDASHLMCPWAGEGVNLAMRDCLDLSKVIEKAVTSSSEAFDGLLRGVEKDMASRAAEEAQGTLDNGEMLFGSDDGATAFKNFFESMPPPEAVPPLE